MPGVVAGDERDARTAVAAGTGEEQPVDGDRLVHPAGRAGPDRTHLLRMEQPVAEVAAGRADISSYAYDG